jgi:N-acetylmuramate 1-kinase
MRNGNIYFIDFQSGRIGSRFYDVASLLCDPYVELPESLHDELFTYYCDTYKKHFNPENFDVIYFNNTYTRVSLQRLMQAIGAYGKLGVGDGKSAFLKHIPPALRLFTRTLSRTTEYPILRALGEKLLSMVK